MKLLEVLGDPVGGLEGSHELSWALLRAREPYLEPLGSGLLGSSWDASGTLLGRFRGPPGPSWGVLGDPFGALEGSQKPSWALLRASSLYFALFFP